MYGWNKKRDIQKENKERYSEKNIKYDKSYDMKNKERYTKEK